MDWMKRELSINLKSIPSKPIWIESVENQDQKNEDEDEQSQGTPSILGRMSTHGCVWAHQRVPGSTRNWPGFIGFQSSKFAKKRPIVIQREATFIRNRLVNHHTAIWSRTFRKLSTLNLCGIHRNINVFKGHLEQIAKWGKQFSPFDAQCIQWPSF